MVLRLSLDWGASTARGFLLALGLSLTLAYSQTFWYESAAASSYVLHYFLVILWLTLMTRVVLEKDKKALKYVCLVTGLALANHVLSLALLALVVWTLVSSVMHKEISVKKALGCCLWLLPGICFYLYLPLRAASDPVINWGDPDSLDRFLRYISRKDYFKVAYVTGPRDLLEVFLFHARAFVEESTPILPILTMALSVMILIRKTKKAVAGRVNAGAGGALDLALLGVALFVLNEFLLSLHGSHLDLFFLKRYSVPGYIGLLFSCVAIITYALTTFSRRVFGFLMPALALIPLLSIVCHYEKNDRSKNTLL
jgi:hypothetical protein